MAERKTRELTRNIRKDLIKDPSSDQLDDAYDEARKLVVLHEDPTTKAGNKPHLTLPGVTQRSGDIIFQVVGMRLQGFRDLDIAEKIGTSQPNISRLESTHPEAFAKAEIHTLTQAERKYKINLWGVRAALSEHAPQMIEVLAEIAMDPSMKENVRRQCAVDILNLTGVGNSRQTIGGKDSNLKAGAVNTFIQTIVEKEKEYSTVIDAEVVEENS